MIKIKKNNLKNKVNKGRVKISFICSVVFMIIFGAGAYIFDSPSKNVEQITQKPKLSSQPLSLSLNSKKNLKTNPSASNYKNALNEYKDEEGKTIIKNKLPEDSVHFKNQLDQMSLQIKKDRKDLEEKIQSIPVPSGNPDQILAEAENLIAKLNSELPEPLPDPVIEDPDPNQVKDPKIKELIKNFDLVEKDLEKALKHLEKQNE